MADIVQGSGVGSQQPQIKFRDMGDGTHAEVVYVEGGGGGGGSDREVVTALYRVIQDGTGYSVGNVLSATRVLDVSGSTATQVGGTIWYNESSAASISAPNSGHIAPMGQPGLTNAELRSQAVSITGTQLSAIQTAVEQIPAPRSGATPVVGFAAVPSATFNRPADTTAYAAGDLVANSTTAGSVTPLSLTAARVAAGSFLASRVRMRKSGTGLTNATFRVYLFNASPTVANGDNDALSAAASATCIGWADVAFAARADSATANPFSDGCFGFGDLNSLVALASGQTVWALIEARAAYTPVSGETFALTLEVAQN